ncbi:hypothetical protein IC229_08240 [Spirosoma sp. BT702]|uniref:Uncharacterized protein n=1 Tax=Spirosoma profusum TaxID=2771354 RepID=A0A926XVP6_9BACT|nr:hypothetical protein [Spirosoma profusum]MBD2700621.1 hypothetical protein [Spirosoma profusum]
MKAKLGYWFMSLLWLALLAQDNLPPDARTQSSIEKLVVSGSQSPLSFPQYNKVLTFNRFRFAIATADTGAVRELVVKAYHSELLLTNFRVRIDGAVAGAEVGDLDGNRFPELYVYTVSNGSGSFGRVYAWQFLADRKADIVLNGWQLPVSDGYMGHDSLWIERDVLCRKYPVYRAGDANAEPSGGIEMKRYKLQPAGQAFVLKAE